MMRETKELRLVYRDFLLEANREHPELVVLEADLSSSMATHKLGEILGKRYINVGIMEAEMVGVAAGLSILGFKPYLHTFGPFATRRVFDQLFLSLGYAQLDATVIGSDAGVTAEMNGGTHMPFEEIGLTRLMPGATIFEVSDDIQLHAVLRQTLNLKGLKYDFSKGFVELKSGEDLIIIATGIMVAPCLRIANELSKQGLDIGVVDLFRVKPLPEELLALYRGLPILSVENHNQIGGIGSALCELFSTDLNTPVFRMGIQERFGQVGKVDYLLKEYGLDEASIKDKILSILHY